MSDEAPRAQRVWRHRPSKQVREILKMLCHLLAERDALRAERERVIQALGLPQDIADGHDLVLAAREIHVAWQAAVEENGQLARNLDYARGALRHAIDATRVELGNPPYADPWPTWLAQWAAAYAGTQPETTVDPKDTEGRP